MSLGDSSDKKCVMTYLHIDIDEFYRDTEGF